MARFIVIEGLDGAGTTTQCELLVRHLDALGTCEPTDGPLGRIARATLGAKPGAPATEVLPWIFAADRADHLTREVLPALSAGRDVVSDRYVPSSLAYQSLTLPLTDVWALNRSFRIPDAVLYVDVPVDTAMARIESRAGAREIYDDHARLLRVHEAYERVMGFLREEGWPIVRIDGRPEPPAVHRAIVEAL